MFLCGDFAMLSPATLLQMMGQEQRSVHIRAWRGEHEATVSLMDGIVVAARCEELSGEEALFRLAIWDSGRFQVTPFEPDETAEMAAGWEELLLEAARRRDELELALPELPPYPTPEQLQALHAECAELSGIALFSLDGRLLGARGMDDDLLANITSLMIMLETTGELLHSDGMLYVTAGRRRLLLAERGAYRVIGEPASEADLRTAASRMAARIGEPALRS